MDETHNIKFADPPPPPRGGRGRGTSKYAPVFLALVDHPGRWAVIATGMTHSNAGVFSRRTGSTYAALLAAGVDRERYEVTTRKESDGTYTVYARYMGGE